MYLLLLVLLAGAALAPAVQAAPPETVVPVRADTLGVVPPELFNGGVGVAVLLTNHGFGAGAFVRTGVGPTTSLVVEASLGAGKDEREQEFFVGPFGETVVPYKRHYFLMLPVQAGVEQRLWARAIEDDFRPFLQALGGPVLGYQWPYFEDADGDGLRGVGEPRRSPLDLWGGSFRLGVGGTLALGAYFGEGARNTLGLRLGYAAQYFFQPVELLEPRPGIEQPDRRFFGTPVVSLQLLRL